MKRLIQAVSTKQEIFVQLIDENQGIIHKICRAYTYTSDEHNDLFQEVVLQLWGAFDSFKEQAKFSTWMYRVALNTAITLYRKKKRSIDIKDTEEIPLIKDLNTFDEDLEEQISLLYKAIKKLSDIERALVLLYLEEKPYKEIADTLGISEVNARVKMNRAKSKLKTIMERWS